MGIFEKFIKEDSGATAVEYALIAAGIAVVLITAVEALGDELSEVFGAVESTLKDSRTVDGGTP